MQPVGREGSPGALERSAIPSVAMSAWSSLAERALAGASRSQPITREEAGAVLHAPADELLAVLDAAFTVRRAYWGRRVSLHVLDNAKLGACPEDCGFCSQSSKHASPSGEAPMKSVEELVDAARKARSDERR